MIFVVDDDEIMAECVAKAAGCEARIFTNAIEAMNEIADGIMPEMIFLDILLVGPDGFTLLNEMVSYEDTARVPVVLVTSLEMAEQDLSNYGVVGILEKETMKPEDVKHYAWQYA